MCAVFHQGTVSLVPSRTLTQSQATGTCQTLSWLSCLYLDTHRYVSFKDLLRRDRGKGECGLVHTAQPRTLATWSSLRRLPVASPSSRNLKHLDISQGLIGTLGSFRNHIVTESCRGGCGKSQEGKRQIRPKPAMALFLLSCCHCLFSPSFLMGSRAKALLPAFPQQSNMLCSYGA